MPRVVYTRFINWQCFNEVMHGLMHTHNVYDWAVYMSGRTGDKGARVPPSQLWGLSCYYFSRSECASAFSNNLNCINSMLLS